MDVELQLVFVTVSPKNLVVLANFKPATEHSMLFSDQFKHLK